MSLSPLTAQKSLNKAYRKVKPVPKGIDVFKENMVSLLDKTKVEESVEFHENLIIEFLRKHSMIQVIMSILAREKT